MAVLGGRRRRNRRQDRRQERRQDTFESAHEDEMKRQAEMRKQEMQRQVFQTTPGEGIAEGANISLGFDEDEDDLFDSLTGLVV